MTCKLNVDALLAHTPIFGDLNVARRVRIAQTGRELQVAKHRFVFRRGDTAGGLYVVASGHIKLSIPSPGGNEKVLEFFGPGQLFGESGMFLERPYMVDAQALEDSVLVCIARDDIYAALERDPVLSRYMLMNLARRMDALVEDIEAVNLQSASQRLACFLLRQPRDGACTRFPYSKGIVASKLGLSPETLSRLLHQLSSAGLISVHGRMVTIHQPEALRLQQVAS
ncbi:Crp/Fnr family transcriptional regulator [Uliginosibacterium sp. H3]|uniref:Crp/Fnr family transcriptional regulator n=1 Tax=Uliginosibacterium silvisoli TaxID=3114758 RepID=A0ABU6K0A3_9RHOO|nr:Crp/Fnr family transcriptional regulator [Uliginosibacterium sp. H3]